MREKGFSLTEMLVVVGLLAILALMAGPALARLLPVQRLRGEAQNAAALLRQARLKAASGHKPVRAAFDCSRSPAPCQAALKTAQYEEGAVTAWRELPGSRHEAPRQVAINPAAGGAARGDAEAEKKEGFYWIIFMPDGRTFSWPRPFELDFSARDLPPAARHWRLEVDGDSGRARLNGSGK